MEEKQLKMRPYARLLAMLGDQLIKNELIAIIELVKNSYDADASWVKISFNNFRDDFSIQNNSSITIEDDGIGMTLEKIEKHWVNPATPIKILEKKKNQFTKSRRVIQGEKGIGRFALLKLGKKIKVVTRSIGEDIEHVVSFDFSKFDNEYLSENGKEKNLFLDDLNISVISQNPKVIKEEQITLHTMNIIRRPYGTRIEISELKNSWSSLKIEDVYSDIIKLQSIMIQGDAKSDSDFKVQFYKDNKYIALKEKYIEDLKEIINNKAVFRIDNGKYIEGNQEFKFKINDKLKTINIKNPDITGLKIFKDNFGDGGKKLDLKKIRKTECGSFTFSFYIFDFAAKVSSKYKLDKEEKKTIRKHRIYLYRDGIRVYPYGNPDDDWLQIDVDRGTISAGYFLSNDQVVGFVYISQKENPKLKDKTNREGLIEEGNATEDFIALLKIFLAYIRAKYYARYRESLKERNLQELFRTELISKNFLKLKAELKDSKDLLNLVSDTEKKYRNERKYLILRAEITEDLAGVGLSVETASHDIMLMMNKSLISLDSLIKDALHGNNLDIKILLDELQSIRGSLGFVESQLKDIQLLFRSSKLRSKNIRVFEILEKVKRIFDKTLKDDHIKLTINTIGPPLIAKTTDAVLLQLFLNLFDNSVYWLRQIDNDNKEITITFDGVKSVLIFSDNGPGVHKDDIPYIFEPFYSGKGEEGRGLGLYIARQLLERYEYSIDLSTTKPYNIMSGANFVVSFISTEKDNDNF